MLTLYTTATLGGYGETLLFGKLSIWLALDTLKSNRRSLLRWLLLGAIAGFAFYTFPLYLVYLVPIGLWLLARRRRKAWRGYAAAAIGFAIGGAPWWIALIQSGGVLLAEMAGSAVAGTVAAPTFLESLSVRLLNFFLFGASAWLGLRYPWSAEFVAPVLGFAVLALYLGALIYAVRRGSKMLSHQRLGIIPWGMIGALLITFLITPFGGDPSGRYFLPLYLPLVIFVAMLLEWVRNEVGTLVVLFIVVVLGYNVAGTLIAAARQPPGITTQFDAVTWIDHSRDQELIGFLLTHGETRGYTNYWVEYPIAFLSQEQIISSARLPYHQNLGYTRRDDRYPPYSQAVAAAPRAFYITTNHPELDDLIRRRLSSLGVTFKEHSIGNYHIFYDLSRKVEPDELGLSDGATESSNP